LRKITARGWWTLTLNLSICACGSTAGIKNPIRAKIITSTDTGYGLKEVSFKTLTNLREMDGELAVLKGDAALNITSEIGEIVTSKDPDSLYSSIGKSVNLDYVVEGDVAIPRNFQSMAMLSIYYHYERIFLFWRDNLGLKLSDFGKLRLFMNPRIEANSGNVSVSQVIKVNAAFLPGPRDFWFFKTSPLEEIPINMNLGVLAHEFGHAAFDVAFAEKDSTFYEIDTNSEAPSHGNEAKSIKLSAFNEGLADYFSWMVTGKLTEFGESLAVLGTERVMPVKWTLSKLEQDVTDRICSGGFYCFGSLFSSALYEIANLDGSTPVSVGRAAYAALSDLRSDWVAAKKGEDFEYYHIINRIFTRLDGVNTSESCKIFKKWFDVAAVKEKIECIE
jgi:hypothetical protein